MLARRLETTVAEMLTMGTVTRLVVKGPVHETISRGEEEEAEAKVRDLGGRSRCPSIPKEEWVQRTWAQRLKMLEDALSHTSE